MQARSQDAKTLHQEARITVSSKHIYDLPLPTPTASPSAEPPEPAPPSPAAATPTGAHAWDVGALLLDADDAAAERRLVEHKRVLHDRGVGELDVRKAGVSASGAVGWGQASHEDQEGRLAMVAGGGACPAAMPAFARETSVMRWMDADEAAHTHTPTHTGLLEAVHLLRRSHRLPLPCAPPSARPSPWRSELTPLGDP